MSVTVNLRHLEEQELHLQGEIAQEELDITGLDDLIQPEGGLRYDLQVERQESGLLVQGQLSLSLRCECARCLSPFRHELDLANWCAMLLWEGEDAVKVRNDCVDLTPYIREDMVLALPQRPLCKPDCSGLLGGSSDKPEATHAARSDEPSSAWAMLNNLKL